MTPILQKCKLRLLEEFLLRTPTPPQANTSWVRSSSPVLPEDPNVFPDQTAFTWAQRKQAAEDMCPKMLKLNVNHVASQATGSLWVVKGCNFGERLSIYRATNRPQPWGSGQIP
jgi:hypothetical protein